MSPIQDTLWFQRLPAARAADQRGQGMGIGPVGYDPMAYTPPVGNVIGGYDYEPMPSQTIMPPAGQGAPPPAAGVGGGQILTQSGQAPPPGTLQPSNTMPPWTLTEAQAAAAGTNPNSPGNMPAANAQAQGQNVPTGGSTPQGGGTQQPEAQQRSAAGMGAIDINTLAGMMALNPAMAAQLLALFAGQMGMGQQTAPASQAEAPAQQPNRNIAGINFRFA